MDAANIRAIYSSFIAGGADIAWQICCINKLRGNIIALLKGCIFSLYRGFIKFLTDPDHAARGLKITGDFLVPDKAGQRGSGGHSLIDKGSCFFGAKTPGQLGMGIANIAAGNPAITGRCPKPYCVFFKDGNLASGSGQINGRRQPGKAATDNGNFCMAGPAGFFCPTGRGICPPVTPSLPCLCHGRTTILPICFLAIKAVCA